MTGTANQNDPYAGTKALTAEYEAWCAAQNVECIDAAELVLNQSLTLEQRQWLADFCERWSETQAAEDRAVYEARLEGR